MRTPYSLFQTSISLLFLGSLSACAFLIPENPSAPRYNKVEGEIRKPQLNAGMANTSAAAPVTPVVQQSIPNLPPVDPSVQARAERELASMQQTGRAVPAENQMVMAGNAADFSNVPPRPVMTGDASAEARLAKVRAELEQDRAAAAASKNQLANDVKTELAPMPEVTGSVPPIEPVAVKPMAPPSPAPAITSPVSVPPTKTVAPMAAAPASPGYIAIPPTPVFAPPPPMGAAAPVAAPAAMVATAPTSVVVDPVVPAPMPISQAPVAPVAAPAKEPILLRPPVAMAPTPVAPPPARSEAPRNMPPAAAGGFNPMADVDTAPARASGVYVTQGYLPSSRYVTQR